MTRGVPGNNEQWGICFVGAAGTCDAELDWSMDLADGAGNGRVRKLRIRAIQDLAESVTDPANICIHGLLIIPSVIGAVQAVRDGNFRVYGTGWMYF